MRTAAALPSGRQLFRDLLLTTALSFLAVLGLAHGAVHLAHMHYLSAYEESVSAVSSLPYTSESDVVFYSGVDANELEAALLSPAIHMAKIVMLHNWVSLLFKLTFMASALVILAREVNVLLGRRFGWWRANFGARSRAASDASDVEAATGFRDEKSAAEQL